MAEDIAEIEAIADTRREDPRVELGVADHVETAESGIVVPSDGGIEPGLLHVEIERPALAQPYVDAALEGETPGVVDADARGAEPIDASAGVEEVDVLNAGADIRLPFAHAGEVILEGEHRGEDPGVGDLAEIGDRALPVDAMFGKAAEQF